jgi:hypothetical protein
MFSPYQMSDKPSSNQLQSAPVGSKYCRKVIPAVASVGGSGSSDSDSDEVAHNVHSIDNFLCIV